MVRMDEKYRIVTRLPLSELWLDSKPLTSIRQQDLSAEEIQHLLRISLVRFVVADVGSPLVWCSMPSYEFWKKEVKPHLAPPDQPAYLEFFPGQYFYFASKWRLPDDTTVVLLEKHH